jgi:S1-C subfamily serine protease
MHDQRGSGMQNTTFFTPIWLIKRVADELIAHFEDTGGITDPDVWHPWLGIKPFAGSISPLTGSFREMGDDLKMYMDIPDQYWDVGVLIDTVWQESPAREFGLLDHDMLLDVTVLHVVQERENEPGKPYEGYDVDDLIEKLPYRLLKGIEELEIMVTTAERGDMLVFGVLRNFSYFQVEVEIGNHPGAFAFLSMMGAYGPGAQIYGVERSEEYF